MAKLQAYELQDTGLDTVEANHALGFKADCRDFSLPAAILAHLGNGRVRLLTNNPRKTQALLSAGIVVVAEVPAKSRQRRIPSHICRKKQKLGHALSLRRHGQGLSTNLDQRHQGIGAPR